MTDEDSPRINYLDLGSDGVETQIADQVAAPSHSGTVTFDSANYKTADTVVVTLDDQDLNTDSELIDVYITKSDDKVGNGNSDHVLDITFNDVLWQDGEDESAGTAGSPDDGLDFIWLYFGRDQIWIQVSSLDHSKYQQLTMIQWYINNCNHNRNRHRGQLQRPS